MTREVRLARGQFGQRRATSFLLVPGEDFRKKFPVRTLPQRRRVILCGTKIYRKQK